MSEKIQRRLAGFFSTENKSYKREGKENILQF